MKQSLDNLETEMLRTILIQLKIKKRTGEIGILHGANRFVGTNLCFRKEELRMLDSIATKVGLATGLDRVNH